MTKIKEKLMLYRSLLKKLLYSFSVLLRIEEQNDMIQDIEAEVHHETIIITKTIIISSPYRRDSRHRYRSRSHPRNNIFQRYTSSFRPPSRPRDPTSSQSRSYSHFRNKINTIQSQTQNDPINFEVRMYHPTELANAVTPTSWFYSLYTHTPPNQIQQHYPSRLEISFLLDSGASISVLNCPTDVTIAKFLNITTLLILPNRLLLQTKLKYPY